jgi:hypothetical protein
MKKNAGTHLQLLKVEADCSQLNKIALDYEKRTGLRPKSIRDLVNAGLLARPPSDPLGIPYILDADGKVQLNPASPLAEQKRLYQKPLAGGLAH